MIHDGGGEEKSTIEGGQGGWGGMAQKVLYRSQERKSQK